MPSEQQWHDSSPAGLDRAAEHEDDVAADEDRDQHPLGGAVLLLEAVDGFGGHAEEAGEPTQRLIAVRPSEEVTDRRRQRQANCGDHHVGDGRDARTDGEDQIAVARRQHDQLFGACVHPVGEDDVGDVGAHHQPDEGDEQEWSVARSLVRLDDFVCRSRVHARAP